MTLNEVRQKYLDFFQKRGHSIVPSAPLVPENDPTTLFTGSGMQPMVPYLLGEKHPLGTRIADFQKSFRATDIDEVGDNRHTTFFEMLGNWSLGDYFKREQIEWIFQFLTEEIGIDPQKLYVTVFIGDEKNNIPKDTESAELWKRLFATKKIDANEVEIGSEENGYKVGMQDGRIFYYNAVKNWWSRAGVPEKMPAGEPGGPDSEMFYEFTDIPHDTKFGQHCHPNCDCGRFLEIGNNVFMEYQKNADGTFSKLPQRNVDFGGGLERIVAASNNTSDVFSVDVLKAIICGIENLSDKKYSDQDNKKTYRVVADHLRAAVFLMGDKVMPSNTDQGYFVRALLRRAILNLDKLQVDSSQFGNLLDIIISEYGKAYPNLLACKQEISAAFTKEEQQLRKNYTKVILREFHQLSQNQPIAHNMGDVGWYETQPMMQRAKASELTADRVFRLHTQDGIDLETIMHYGKIYQLEPEDGFEEKLKKLLDNHRQLSRTGAEQKFKGGLADTSVASLKYHTATHLLHQALREVLGAHVGQKGSNITSERLRFDFTHTGKMTPEEINKVENIVNEKIQKKMPVQKVVLPIAEAEKTGALHFFGEKYGDQVNVYYIGDSLETAFSKEFCGGPHVQNTSEIGKFKITKEEAVSAGVRRIKAVVE